MLEHLGIRDFAIVGELDLELGSGMTALTGETGAGKSIMVDALALILGERADVADVRAGAGRAELTAVFDLAALPAASAWLRERELEGDGECVLRRVIGREARSRAFINGVPQPLQALKALGDLLVDIHGQHEHQSLLRREAQLQLLDDFGGHQPALAELAAVYRRRRELARALAELGRSAEEGERRRALLDHDLAELEALGLAEGELAALEDEHRRLANAGHLLESCQGALARLYEAEPVSVHALLGQTRNELESLAMIDAGLRPVAGYLDSALIQVQEATDELRRYAGGVDLDPERLQWVEQRLAAVHQLARKHRVHCEELPGLVERLRAEREELGRSAGRGEALAGELREVESDYDRRARELSTRRAEAARVLEDGVGEAMQALGMPGGSFEVALSPRAEPAQSGMDEVEFRVSANPGQPRRPLARVASGGELSRISLAIQVITAGAARIPTLVFDEVDTGIGGGTAEVVGRHLRALGEARQVLCVTHLPQVAAQAHRHLRVLKRVDRGVTAAKVEPLDEAGKVGEIGRMLGGVELTGNTLAHAREMIERARGT